MFFDVFRTIYALSFCSVVITSLRQKNALKMIVSVSDSAALFILYLCARFCLEASSSFWHSDFFIFIVFVLLSFLWFTHLLTHLLHLLHLLTSLTYLLTCYLITIIIIYNILISFVCAHIRTHVRTHTANKAQKKEVQKKHFLISLKIYFRYRIRFGLYAKRLPRLMSRLCAPLPHLSHLL